MIWLAVRPQGIARKLRSTLTAPRSPQSGRYDFTQEIKPCRHEAAIQRRRWRIWTMTRKEAARLAYLVATPQLLPAAMPVWSSNFKLLAYAFHSPAMRENFFKRALPE